MGLNENSVTWVHKECGGLIDFDSFGNMKCLKCNSIIKCTKLIEARRELNE